MADSSNLTRYARQVVLREVGVNGQQVLLNSAVLIVGMGGLGAPASLYLAAAGVGRLILADRDRVELNNLQRQILYSQDDVGRTKTAAATLALGKRNASITIETIDGEQNAESLQGLVPQADAVLDCSDNFPTRFAINEACVRARKPLVSGAAIRFEGQLATFDARRADSPCYACLYPDQGDAQETCEESGVLGPVVGTVGGLQALVALKLLLGIGDDVGRLHRWNALDMSWKTVTVPRDPRCAACAHE